MSPFLPEGTPDPRAPDVPDLLRCLGKRLTVDALVLFGSRARGDAFVDSDWDLAVVSSDFEGLDPLERGLAVMDCRPPAAELVHLTPAELLEPDLSYLRAAILEEGVALHDRGAFRRAKRRYDERKATGEIRFDGESVRFEPK